MTPVTPFCFITKFLERQYLRNCKPYVKKLAVECLKRFGVYIFPIIVGQPGVGVKTTV